MPNSQDQPWILDQYMDQFLDLVLKEQSRALPVEQIEIPEGSGWSGLSLDHLHPEVPARADAPCC